ncbi:MAG: SPOR domain-containing protein [Rugosibacter sp.]|nr:MAG: SPOR domain-containing protein [Rugosibacter sp.]TBR11616.1 MAG: SPOR domain-containing protein [Rugosibacter sp.]
MTENDISADPELQLKKRARRRLVGAAALALLAVIVLPMLMDHDPRPPVQDIQVKIPSRETGGLAAKILSNDAVVRPLPAVQPKAVIPDAASTGASLAPREEAPPEAPAGNKTENNPAPILSESSPTSADPGVQQWVVQLGAYKETGNVKQLLAKMKELRLPAYTEKLSNDQGVRTRVRVGPFASREAADKAEAKIKKIGVTGKVTAK